MQTLQLFATILLNWSASFSFALAAASSNLQERTVLVTGGAGYIGSHTCVELLSLPEYKVVVMDNLDNSSEESLKRVSELAGCDPERLVFRNCDLRDKEGLQKSMREWLGVNFNDHFPEI
jgi:UDP-glucose 4-epimerase